MTRRLVLSYLLVSLIVLLILEIPLAIFYYQLERERFIASFIQRLSSALAKAGIDAELSSDMGELLWRKFALLSPMATTGSCFDVPVQQIEASDESRAFVHALVGEITAVGRALGMQLHGIEKEVEKIRLSVGAGAKSSMHLDFEQGRQTEVDSLVSWVVRAGRRLGIPTPTYSRALETLTQRQAGRRAE